ncbi:MAG: hypothetical protein AAFV93_02100 [Chloroflexota bacterium]
MSVIGEQYFLLLITGFIIIFLSACGTTPEPSATATPATINVNLPDSPWGTVSLIGQAPQLSAPAFAYTPADRIITWTGIQADNLATHYAIGITDEQSELDVPTFFPQQQMLFATTQGALKIWLDRNASESGLRLHASTLNFDGTLATGIIPISVERTRNYDVMAIDTRQFRIVTSGGLGEITNLYLYQIDDTGRPSGGELLQIDGDHPTLLRDNQGQNHLFWLNDNGRNVFYAQFDEIATPNLVNVRQIARTNIAVTDAILDFSIAYDGTTVYLFWTIRRVDDTQVVLVSSGQLSDERFSSPAPLLTPDGDSIQWVSPGRQFQRPIPIVANHDETLSVLWLADGAIIDNELVVESGRLIGLPQIDTATDRIGISWAQPTNDGYANLFFVERPRLP